MGWDSSSRLISYAFILQMGKLKAREGKGLCGVKQEQNR
jgi:hypothetical protein